MQPSGRHTGPGRTGRRAGRLTARARVFLGAVEALSCPAAPWAALHPRNAVYGAPRGIPGHQNGTSSLKSSIGLAFPPP